MIRVCVVDDQTLVRHGIRSLLELSDQVEVVAEASDGDEALRVLEADPPDVLLLDLRMPGRDGIGTLTAMAERGLAVPTLVLTTFDDEELVLRALRAGARGYLLKDVTLEQLVEGISTLAAGGTLVQPMVTDRLLRALSDLPDGTGPAPGAGPASGSYPGTGWSAGIGGSGGSAAPTDGPLEQLTPREQEILRLLAAGYANREIAGALHLAEGTVKNHVSNLLTKLGVRDRTRAVLRALQLGLLTGPPGG